MVLPTIIQRSWALVCYIFLPHRDFPWFPLGEDACRTNSSISIQMKFIWCDLCSIVILCRNMCSLNTFLEFLRNNSSCGWCLLLSLSLWILKWSTISTVVNYLILFAFCFQLFCLLFVCWYFVFLCILSMSSKHGHFAVGDPGCGPRELRGGRRSPKICSDLLRCLRRSLGQRRAGHGRCQRCIPPGGSTVEPSEQQYEIIRISPAQKACSLFSGSLRQGTVVLQCVTWIAAGSLWWLGRFRMVHGLVVTWQHSMA